MFAKVIDSSCSFVSAQANEAFSSTIFGSGYNNDLSFVALMRALLSKRIKDEEHECVSCSVMSVSTERANMASDNQRFFREFRVHEFPETIAIRNIVGTEAARNRFFERLDRCASELQGYRELLDLKVYFSKSMNVRFFVNEEARKTIIVIEECTIRKYHLLASLLPRYLSWYFIDNRPDEFEQKLLHSMMEKSSEKFDQLIEEAYRSSDIRTRLIRNMVSGFERRAREAELESSMNDVRRLMEQITEYRNIVRDLIIRKDGLNIRIEGLQSSINSAGDDSELIEYFSRSKVVIPVRVSGSELTIVVKTYLETVDPDAYERIINNRSSFANVLDADGIFADRANRKQLLDALFSSEPVLKLKTCAMYKLDARGYVSTESYYDYPRECYDMIPNPHIHHHACMGDHARAIDSALEAGNMIGAIEQCVASAKAMNIVETASARPFMRDLFGEYSCRKSIELPDGTGVTPEDALRWLKEKEGSDE